MLPWEKVLEGVNSPWDWAIAIGAGTLGFSLDAAINIVPFPVFSPGVCGVTAITSSMALKKSFDAAQGAGRRKRLNDLIFRRALDLVDEAKRRGDHPRADYLIYLMERAKIDPAQIEALDAVVVSSLNRQPKSR
jgi:hypothetical protein